MSQKQTTLEELLALAGSENVIVRTPDGREFIVAEIDDFEHEIDLVRQNEELMQFLAQRSDDQETFTLAQVREELDLV